MPTGRGSVSWRDSSAAAEAAHQFLQRVQFVVRDVLFTQGGDGGGQVFRIRATPADRSYLIVHQEETALLYSPDTARTWGMDLCGDLFDIDGHEGDYGCSHMLTTTATPNTVSGDAEAGFHGSMGTDRPMAKDANGYPLNQRAYLYMMMAR